MEYGKIDLIGEFGKNLLKYVISLAIPLILLDMTCPQSTGVSPALSRLFQFWGSGLTHCFSLGYLLPPMQECRFNGEKSDISILSFLFLANS